MLSTLKDLWRKGAPNVKAKPAGSAYFDGDSVFIIKSRCWIQGPLYIEDAPSARFPASEKQAIQAFLVQILTSPTKIERDPAPTFDATSHKKLLKVKSLKAGVERYRHVNLTVDGDSLHVTPSRRDPKSKGWSYSTNILKCEKWLEDLRAADVLLNAFSVCE